MRILCLPVLTPVPYLAPRFILALLSLHAMTLLEAIDSFTLASFWSSAFCCMRHTVAARATARCKAQRGGASLRAAVAPEL